MADLQDGAPSSMTDRVVPHVVDGNESSDADITRVEEQPELTAGTRTKQPLGAMFWVATTFLVLLALAAIFAELFPYDFDERFQDPDTGRTITDAGPTWKHPLGTDGSGRDIFTRVIYGAQISLIIASVGAALALVVGGLIGLTAGYYRGRIDSVIITFTDATLVIPPLILALSLILFIDPDAERRILILIVVFVLLSLAPIARVVRASTLVWSEREFVLASKTMGARNGRIMFRDVLPNVAPALISYSLIIMAQLIVVEGAVAFLGLSVPPPTPTWGDMINKGRADLGDAPHITMMPAMAMFFTVLALNFIGDKLQERFEPRESVL